MWCSILAGPSCDGKEDLSAGYTDCTRTATWLQPAVIWGCIVSLQAFWPRGTGAISVAGPSILPLLLDQSGADAGYSS